MRNQLYRGMRNEHQGESVRMYEGTRVPHHFGWRIADFGFDSTVGSMYAVHTQQQRGGRPWFRVTNPRAPGPLAPLGEQPL
jgi:hypothetical protein